jgi:hypothetical protein
MNAFQLESEDADGYAAMWAACQLMAVLEDRPELMQEYADLWAKKWKLNTHSHFNEDPM